MVLEEEPQGKVYIRANALGHYFHIKNQLSSPLVKPPVKSEFSRHWQKLRVRRPAAQIYRNQRWQRSRTVTREVMAWISGGGKR